jgi:hypothetical protein
MLGPVGTFVSKGSSILSVARVIPIRDTLYLSLLFPGWFLHLSYSETDAKQSIDACAHLWSSLYPSLTQPAQLAFWHELDCDIFGRVLCCFSLISAGTCLSSSYIVVQTTTTRSLIALAMDRRDMNSGVRFCRWRVELQSFFWIIDSIPLSYMRRHLLPSFIVLESCSRRYQRHKGLGPRHRESFVTVHAEGVSGYAVVPAGLPKSGDSGRRGTRVLPASLSVLFIVCIVIFNYLWTWFM